MGEELWQKERPMKSREREPPRGAQADPRERHTSGFLAYKAALIKVTTLLLLLQRAAVIVPPPPAFCIEGWGGKDIASVDRDNPILSGQS